MQIKIYIIPKKRRKIMMKLLSWEYARNIIRNTTPSLRYKEGEDFSLWQKRCREKLSELLCLGNIKRAEDDKFTLEYVKDEADFTEYRFTLQSEEGYTFPAVMRVPKGKKAPMPLIITLQGHSTGMHISIGKPIYPKDEESINGGDRDFVVRAVKEGYVAVAIEQRNFGEVGYKEGDYTVNRCHMESMNAIISGRTTIGERVTDVSCTIDAVLREFDFIDKEKIVLMGNSGGGTATLYAAALDERIALAMPSCAVCTYKDSIAAMPHCVCNFVPNIANYFDMGDIGGLIAPRKLIVVNGKEDDIFPEAGVREAYSEIERLYRVAGVSENAALVTGDGGHRFYADDSWPVVHKMMGV